VHSAVAQQLLAERVTIIDVSATYDDVRRTKYAAGYVRRWLMKPVVMVMHQDGTQSPQPPAYAGRLPPPRTFAFPTGHLPLPSRIITIAKSAPYQILLLLLLPATLRLEFKQYRTMSE